MKKEGARYEKNGPMQTDCIAMGALITVSVYLQYMEKSIHAVTSIFVEFLI